MIKAYAKSDVGKVRDMNQDAYYISDSLDEVQLYMLADGMGGYKGGEIASNLAVKTAKNYIENNFKDIPKDRDSIIQLVGSSMEYANMVVYEKSKESKELEGMGTTLEICLIYNNKVFIGHIGDSRVYRIRKEFMRKLTQDHSYVQKLVKDGTITQEQAAHHPQKNVITRALGSEKVVEADIYPISIGPGDTLLLCSDGLSNLVPEEEISAVLRDSDEPETACRDLLDLALSRKAPDNVTIVVWKR